jgi:hypothetical protein
VGDTLVRPRETAERALQTAHSLNSLLQGGVKSDPRLAQVVVRTEALKSTAADLLLEILISFAFFKPVLGCRS